MKDAGRLRVRVTLKNKRGTRATLEAEQEHIRGITRGQRMYSRGTRDEQQRYNRCPTPNREYIIPYNYLY